MRALVTGGAGFIGSHLVRRLVMDGHEVHILDSGLSTSPYLSPKPLGRIHQFDADVRDLAAVNSAARNCDVIFHQAAIPSVVKSFKNPQDTLSVGIDGTLNVMLAARTAGIRRVVAASSSAVYGDSPLSPKTESMPLHPISPYAISKQVSEQLGEILGPKLGIVMVSLRYFNVYGPGQRADSDYAAVIPRFLELVHQGATPTVFGDGEQTRDFIHVDDVVRANLLAATATIGESVALNIGSGRALSINSLLATIGSVVGRRVQAIHGPVRTGDILHSVADVTRAEIELGFRAQTGLSSSLSQMAQQGSTGA